MEALRRGELTPEALLVAAAVRRLRAAGVDVPPPPELPDGPELALYRALGASDPRTAHARYNSLVRRLVSFERALDQRRRRRTSPSGNAVSEPRPALARGG